MLNILEIPRFREEICEDQTKKYISEFFYVRK